MPTDRLPSRPELIAELAAANDKAKTLLEGVATVERLSELSSEIFTTSRRWRIAYAGGGWDLFEVELRGLAPHHRHIDTFATAGKAVGFVASILTDESNGPVRLAEAGQ